MDMMLSPRQQHASTCIFKGYFTRLCLYLEGTESMGFTQDSFFSLVNGKWLHIQCKNLPHDEVSYAASAVMLTVQRVCMPEANICTYKPVFWHTNYKNVFYALEIWSHRSCLCPPATVYAFALSSVLTFMHTCYATPLRSSSCLAWGRNCADTSLIKVLQTGPGSTCWWIYIVWRRHWIS